MNTPARTPVTRRRGIVAVLSGLLLVFLLGMVAFAIDVGYMFVADAHCRTRPTRRLWRRRLSLPATRPMPTGRRGRLPRQTALRPGRSTKARSPPNSASGIPIRGLSRPAEAGQRRPRGVERNAISLFFAPVLGIDRFNTRASAVAMSNPRDIAFVVDLSGSMNNDTEPCWATSEINNTFGPEGYPTIGDELMEDLYEDFGYGSFPGPMQYVGQPLGVGQDQYAYAELTKKPADRSPPAALPRIPYSQHR